MSETFDPTITAQPLSDMIRSEGTMRHAFELEMKKYFYSTKRNADGEYEQAAVFHMWSGFCIAKFVQVKAKKMIDKDRIKQEFDRFIEFDTDDRSYVTTTSTLLFAEHITKLVRNEMASKVSEMRKILADIKAWDISRALDRTTGRSTLFTLPQELRQKIQKEVE